MLIEINEQGETRDGIYKLMPKELTQEMILAMTRVRCEADEYTAALAVAPLPSPEAGADPDFSWDKRRDRVLDFLFPRTDEVTPYAVLDALRSLSIEIEKRMADLRDEIQRTDG